MLTMDRQHSVAVPYVERSTIGYHSI